MPIYLPASLDRSSIYATWLGLTGLGIIGYVLYRRGHVLAGLALMGAHAAFGFDGFLHYTRAPMAAHTAMMNFTIWTEAAAALLLSCVVLARFIARVARTA